MMSRLCLENDHWQTKSWQKTICVENKFWVKLMLISMYDINLMPTVDVNLMLTVDVSKTFILDLWLMVNGYQLLASFLFQFNIFCRLVVYDS